MHDVAPWCKSDQAFASFEWWHDMCTEELTVIVRCDSAQHSISIPRHELTGLIGSPNAIVSVLNKYTTGDIEWRKMERDNTDD